MHSCSPLPTPSQVDGSMVRARRPLDVLETACAWVAFTAAVLVYLNTLPAGFAFDDNFAVVSKHKGQVALP